MLALPLPSAEIRFRELPFQLHKNVGLTLLLLLPLMLGARWLGRGTPERPERRNSRWLRRIAAADRTALYLLIVAACTSGYLSSSYSGWSTTLWWLADLPHWGREDERLNQLYSDIHLWTCWALLAAIALHVGAALYHAFRNDGVIRRIARW